jgi:hypothetical protein
MRGDSAAASRRAFFPPTNARSWKSRALSIPGAQTAIDQSRPRLTKKGAGMKNLKKSMSGPGGVIAVALAICLAPTALKVAGVVDRPWWLVTLPLWAWLAIFVAFGLVMAIATVVIAIFDGKAQRR